MLLSKVEVEGVKVINAWKLDSMGLNLCHILLLEIILRPLAICKVPT